MRTVFRLSDRLARRYGRWGIRAGALIDRSDHLWLVTTAILLRLAQWLVVAYLVFVIYSIVGPGNWPFSLHADTRLAVVEFTASTPIQWDISAATLCLKHDMAPTTHVYRRINDTQTVIAHCGSTRLQAYRPVSKDGIAPQLSIEFGAGGHAIKHAYTARFASLRDGRVILRIASRIPSNDASLKIVGSGQVQARLTDTATFTWPTNNPDTSLLFPFKGQISIGQDVTTSRHTLLEKGRIDVYSASDKEATGRSLIDSIDLLPGDHVKIRSDNGESADSPASGFVRLASDAMGSRWPQMNVVAFGLSNHIKIARYGEAGLDFAPSLWARLTHNNWVVIFSLVLFGGLSILKTLAEAARLIRRTNAASAGEKP